MRSIYGVALELAQFRTFVSGLEFLERLGRLGGRRAHQLSYVEISQLVVRETLVFVWLDDALMQNTA